MNWVAPEGAPARVAVGQIWYASGVYVEVEQLEPGAARARSFLTGQPTPLPYDLALGGSDDYWLALDVAPEPGPPEPPVPPPDRWRPVDWWWGAGSLLLTVACAGLVVLGVAFLSTFLLTKHG